MQYVWGHRLWPAGKLVTTDGRRVAVIDPGQLNNNSGPDFFNAKIKIEGETWVGNVEIHMRASDWHRHGHDGDPAYDNVVLHVVDRSDTLIERPDGSHIPQLEMPCIPDLNRHYAGLINTAPTEIACRETISQSDSVFLRDWLDSLAMERVYEKADRVERWAAFFNDDWEQAAFIGVARALGAGINGDMFERLAMNVPLRVVARHNDSLLMTEAFLFGQSQLLAMAPPNEYADTLRREHNFLCTKFSLKPPQGMLWKMARMRPANFPHRRIALLASILHRSTRLFSRLVEVVKCPADTRNKLMHKIFALPPEGFWRHHYTFSDSHSETALSSSVLGPAMLDTLLINGVVPTVIAFANRRGEYKLADAAIDCLHTINGENNTIVRAFKEAGLPCEDAADSQAIIQLRRNYCEQRKCLFCRLGHRTLSSKVARV